MNRAIVRSLAVLVLWFGLALLGNGGYLQGKAWLAQQLLNVAWMRSVAVTPAGAGPVKAWWWADTWPVARLRVPSLGVEQVVLNGTSGEALAFGPGHLAGSARPGAEGNLVVAGHRDTHFEFTRRLARGDAIWFDDRNGSSHRYVVTDIAVVDERDSQVLASTRAREMTLITCYPFDAVLPGGPLRYVVRGRLQPEPRAATAQASTAAPGAPSESAEVPAGDAAPARLS